MTNPISWKRTLDYLRADAARYFIRKNVPLWYALAVFFHSSGLQFSFWYRIERYLLFNSFAGFRVIGYAWYPIYFCFTYYVLDYHIEPYVDIDGGLFLHNRSIVITDNTVIGKNSSIMGQVTIGTGFKTNHFKINIGNNVQIGAGAKIIAKGRLKIVSDVTIGANAVVVKDILQPGTYVGIPVKKIDNR